MKKMSLMLSVCSLVFLGCQKDQIKQEEVRYSDYYVYSPNDKSKLITIEEYNKIIDATGPEKTERGRNWVDCFYENRDGEWAKGKTCTGTLTQGCSEPAGCRGGTYLP